MASVKEVAAYIIEQSGGSIDAIKLQKLVYYSQGWYLVAEGAPLFDEPVKAYRHGPVVGSLWNLHRGLSTVTVEVLEGASSGQLTPAARDVIDAVLDTYGLISKWDLVKQTHRERPWIDAWDDYYDDRITPEAMQRYFTYVSAVPSSASGPIPQVMQNVTYALASDLVALGDLDTPDDISRILASVSKA